MVDAPRVADHRRAALRAQMRGQPLHLRPQHDAPVVGVNAEHTVAAHAVDLRQLSGNRRRADKGECLGTLRQAAQDESYGKTCGAR